MRVGDLGSVGSVAMGGQDHLGYGVVREVDMLLLMLLGGGTGEVGSDRPDRFQAAAAI